MNHDDMLSAEHDAIRKVDQWEADFQRKWYGAPANGQARVDEQILAEWVYEQDFESVAAAATRQMPKLGGFRYQREDTPGHSLFKIIDHQRQAIGALTVSKGGSGGGGTVEAIVYLLLPLAPNRDEVNTERRTNVSLIGAMLRSRMTGDLGATEGRADPGEVESRHPDLDKCHPRIRSRREAVRRLKLERWSTAEIASHQDVRDTQDTVKKDVSWLRKRNLLP